MSSALNGDTVVATKQRHWKAVLLWLILIPAVPLLLCASLASYVAISGQDVSVGGDTLLLEVTQSGPGGTFLSLEPSASANTHTFCGGGNCVKTACTGHEIFLAGLQATLIQCNSSRYLSASPGTP